MIAKKEKGFFWSFLINNCLGWTDNVLFMPFLMENKGAGKIYFLFPPIPKVLL